MAIIGTNKRGIILERKLPLQNASVDWHLLWNPNVCCVRIDYNIGVPVCVCANYELGLKGHDIKRVKLTGCLGLSHLRPPKLGGHSHK